MNRLARQQEHAKFSRCTQDRRKWKTEALAALGSVAGTAKLQTCLKILRIACPDFLLAASCRGVRHVYLDGLTLEQASVVLETAPMCTHEVLHAPARYCHVQ